MLNYGFTDMFSVQGELLYSQKDASQDGVSYVSDTSATGLPTIGNDGTAKITLDYIDVPMLLKVNTGESGKGFFFEIGPQGSFLLHQRTFVENGSGKQAGSSYTSTDGFNKAVIGYVGSLGYQITSSLGLGVRYTGDISQVYKDNAGGTLHNSVFQFQAHYLFGGK